MVISTKRALKMLLLLIVIITPSNIIAHDETHYAKSPISIDKKGNKTVVVTDKRGQILYMRVISELKQLEVTRPIKGDVYSDFAYVIPAYVDIAGQIYTVVGIGDGAFGVRPFHINPPILYIEFPSTIKYIGKRAFNGLLCLKKIDLPDGLLSIGNEAFWQCGMGNNSFGPIYIPKSVKSIGKKAFRTIGTNYSKSNGNTRAEFSCLPDFVNQGNCENLGIDASAVRRYLYSNDAELAEDLESYLAQENAKSQKEDSEAMIGIINRAGRMISQVASAMQTQNKQSVSSTSDKIVDDFNGLTMDEYLNSSKISKEKLDAMIDPAVTLNKFMARENTIEQSYYDEFRKNFKKPDGSDYSFMEYKYILHLQEQENNDLYNANVDDLSENDNQIDSDTSENNNKNNNDDNRPIYKSDTTKSSDNKKSTTQTTTNTTSKGTSKEQFKTGNVDDKDYKFLRKISLYRRDAEIGKYSRSGELYKKGAFEYVKLGNTYYKRMYSNWQKFSNQIVTESGGALYY